MMERKRKQRKDDIWSKTYVSHLLILYKLGITVHATKYPNVLRRPYGTLAEDKGSTTRAMSGLRNIQLDYKIRVEISNI